MSGARRLAAAVACALALAAVSAAQDAKKTEAELKAIKAEIARVTREVSRDQVEKDRLTKELKSVELSVGEMRESLEQVRKERAERAQKRAALAAEKRERTADLARERESLAGQLRAAYLIGRNEPLKLLLNQQDPTRTGRMFAYYSYFGRARAEQIERINTNLARLEELDAELAAEDGRLAALEAQRQSELQRLDAARAKRGLVLASLQAEARTRVQTLERMKQQQAGLEKLLRDLKRAMEKFPAAGIDPNTAFGRLRGQLAWPVAGKLVARFGEERVGGLKWDGVLVATERGDPVRAVAPGRVVYADWLPGLGLLTIVDHGDGYLSLYGHNERLYKAVGDRVAAGEPVAAAGDSGGRPRPELYFEIRKGGRPVDPRPWFKRSAP
ncbi:MAG TPA: peptidoglycan DD-metalloendopeptidase family protein [Steroidobacteraceae bacterium]|jgi:septal ring factor EnvC (AmiA/AmiB activator)|nr:peptidoglycan DD-metalloendopeptidase family protein [Steroidobacteraceae bacterium]